MWFFVTPQPPKPSMLQVLDGSWTPNNHDLSSNLVAGFGVTTMIINGGIECGKWNANAQNRARYYTDFAGRLGVDITGEKLLCNDMAQFSDQGAIGQKALYWSPNNNCKLGIWQTAYSALVEGDYKKCRGLAPTCPNVSEATAVAATTSVATTVAATTSQQQTTAGTVATPTTTVVITEATTTSGGKICDDPNGFYADPGDCAKYYQCAHGTPYHYSCPAGTLWNQDRLYCDWVANVECEL